nr:VWA domain-containing protein [Saccharibacillus sp. JS10]
MLRPFLWTEHGTGGNVVVVADVSASMSAVYHSDSEAQNSTASVTRLDEMKRQILNDTAQSTGMTLLKMGGTPEVIVSSSDDTEAWKSGVEQLQPSFGSTSYLEALSLASAVAKQQEDARIIVYTDGQWDESVEDLGIDVPIEVRRISAGNYRNASVQQFGVEGNRAVGVVANTGDESMEVTVELSEDGRSTETRTVQLPAGKRETVSFEQIDEAEVYRLSLTGAADDYSIDDNAFAFPESDADVHVLWISKGNLFLEKALRLSRAEVTRLDVSGNASDSSENKSGQASDQASDLPLPEKQPDIVIIEGQVPSALQSDKWASVLNKAAIWRIGGAENTQQPANRRVELRSHPLTRYLALEEPYFGALTEGEPTGLQTVMSIDNQPAIAAGTEQGRRSLWFGFNLENGDLPLNSEFPVLINNAVNWLSGGRGGGLGRAVPGALVEIPIAAGAESANWRPLQGYAFEHQNDAEPNADAVSVSQKGLALNSSQAAPSVPGLYAFEQQGSGLEAAPVYLLDVSADLSESVSPSSENPLLELVSTEQGTDGSTLRTGSSEDFRNQLPLTVPIVVVIIAIMLTEWGVYRRGRSI